MIPKDVVKQFWKAMQTNDFTAASNYLSADYELIWPQSSERIVGPEKFAMVNKHYPANGLWKFKINSLVGDGEKVVSDVSVSDGVVQARAITFSTVRDGKIVKQLEFWPDTHLAQKVG